MEDAFAFCSASSAACAAAFAACFCSASATSASSNAFTAAADISSAMSSGGEADILFYLFIFMSLWHAVVCYAFLNRLKWMITY